MAEPEGTPVRRPVDDLADALGGTVGNLSGSGDIVILTPERADALKLSLDAMGLKLANPQPALDLQAVLSEAMAAASKQRDVRLVAAGEPVPVSLEAEGDAVEAVEELLREAKFPPANGQGFGTIFHSPQGVERAGERIKAQRRDFAERLVAAVSRHAGVLDRLDDGPSLVSGEGDGREWTDEKGRVVRPEIEVTEAGAVSIRLYPTGEAWTLSLSGRFYGDDYRHLYEWAEATQRVLARPVSVSTGGDERTLAELRDVVSKDNERAAEFERRVGGFVPLAVRYGSDAERVEWLLRGIEQTRAAALVPSTGGEGQVEPQSVREFRAFIEGIAKGAGMNGRLARDLLAEYPEPQGTVTASERAEAAYHAGFDDGAKSAAPASASVPEDAEGVLEDAIHAAAGVHDEIDVAAAAAVLADRGWRLSPVPGVGDQGEAEIEHLREKLETVLSAGRGQRAKYLAAKDALAEVRSLAARGLANGIAEAGAWLSQANEERTHDALRKLDEVQTALVAATEVLRDPAPVPAPVSPVTEDEAETPAVWCDTCGTRLDSAHPGDSCDGWLTGSCPGTFRPTPDASEED